MFASRGLVSEMLTGNMLIGKLKAGEVQKNVDVLYQEIGTQIKMARRRKGLTQDELSEMIHLSRSSIANIEHGRHKFQAHVLYEISSALDCRVTDLLPGV
jgi:DNA-binding XRE family transcriptional regulator